MRLLGTIAGVFCFACLLNAGMSAYDFDHDPVSYAAKVCDQGVDSTNSLPNAPPADRADSDEHQSCLNGYRSMTPIDVAGKSLLFAGGALIVTVAAFVFSKETVPETQARPDR